MASPPPCDPALLDEAFALARQAGDFTLGFFRTDELVVEHKDDATPVTGADRGAERLLREELARRHPDDAVLGEEEEPTPGTSGRTWIIDPIDGTKAFTHGVPLFSNLLAAEDEHGPLLGVINIPALPEVVYAGRGLGCFVDGRPCRVSAHTEVAGAYVTTSGFTDWPPGLLEDVRGVGAHVRTWGDGYGYALVATGRVEAMVDHSAAVWDLAPMAVVIGEAGGRFTDLDGRDQADGGHGLATNGVLHDELLGLLTARDP
jgi:histidinol-phosphatase